MWTTFAAVTGGTAGGLSSLVFLVVAFRFDTIAVSQEYRNRAAQSLTLFMTITVVAVLLTVPQNTRALGIEMVLVALLSASLLTFLDSAAQQQQTISTSRVLTCALSLFVGCAPASGLLILSGEQWGMYFYVASAVIGLLSGVYGAWIFLTRAGLSRTTAG